MTATTLNRPKAPPAPSNGHRPPAAAPERAGRRNRTRIALGLLVIVLSVLGSVSLYSSAGDRVEVIAVRRAVPAGRVVTNEDLGTASIAPRSGLATVPVAARARVVGKVTAVGLVPGSLVAPGQLGDGPALQDGMAIAGAVLKPGQHPVGLQAGDEVMMVETPSPGGTDTGSDAPVERGRARVLDVAASTDGSSAVTVSLVVPTTVASSVASAGAAGRLSLVVVGGP